MDNIALDIKDKEPLTSDLISRWNTTLHILKENHIANVAEITPVLAEKYRFDLAGLLMNEMNIPEKHVYPHIIINGYDSSYSYDGKKLRLSILSEHALDLYYKLLSK